jgi:hypothetical protein
MPQRGGRYAKVAVNGHAMKMTQARNQGAMMDGVADEKLKLAPQR